MTAETKKTKKKANHYLDNANLMREIIKSKQNQKDHPEKSQAECITPELYKMFQTLINRYTQKGNWRSYSWLEDMRSEAMLILIVKAFKFDETKYDNPFGYYTQCTKNSIFSTWDKEDRQRKAKDAILIRAGYNPSMSGQMENDSFSGEGSWDDMYDS